MQESIQRLAEDGNGIFARQLRLAGPLLATNRRIVESSYAGAYATGPGAAGGVFGRLTRGSLSLLGGVVYAEDKDGRAELRNAVTIAGALRYVHDRGGPVRLFAEAGGWIAPGADLRLSRSYMNGAGTATGVGDTRGEIGYYYVRLGAALVGRGNELAISGEIGRSRLDMDAYVEPLSMANPFEGDVGARSERMTVVRLRGQYSHTFAPGLEGSLWGSAVWGRHDGGGVFATVPGVGPVAGFARNPAWAEFGARLGYDIGRRSTVEIFADGSTGEGDVGTGVHGGIAVRTRF